MNNYVHVGETVVVFGEVTGMDKGVMHVTYNPYMGADNMGRVAVLTEEYYKELCAKAKENQKPNPLDELLDEL